MSDQSSGNQSYVGQRGFTSGTGEYNTLEYIFNVLAGKMATVTLVQVTAVHPGSGLLQGTVDVQLLVNQQDALGNATAHGIVYGLPYARIQAGAAAFILDPIKGDIGVAVFASRDISSVLANTANLTANFAAGKYPTVNPGSFRRFDYADGIYLFAAASVTQPTDYVQVIPAGGIKILDRFGNSIITGSAGVDITDDQGNTIATSAAGIAMDDKFGGSITMGSAGISMIDASGNNIATASGGITINGILFPTGGNAFDIKTHTHTQPNDSHGDTEQPTNAPTNGS